MYGDGVADEWAPQATVEPSADWWRPTRSLAELLTWVFVVQAVVQLANVFAVDNAEVYVRWHRAFDALLDGRNEAAQRILDQNKAEGNPWGSVLTFVAVAALVLHIVWTWRSAHNSSAWPRLRISPMNQS